MPLSHTAYKKRDTENEACRIRIYGLPLSWQKKRRLAKQGAVFPSDHGRWGIVLFGFQSAICAIPVNPRTLIPTLNFFGSFRIF